VGVRGKRQNAEFKAGVVIGRAFGEKILAKLSAVARNARQCDEIALR
jgi:hypothetical protein